VKDKPISLLHASFCFFSILNFFFLRFIFRAVTKLFKPTLKTSKDESSPPPIPAKQLPIVQPRPSMTQQQTTSPLARTNSMSKSMTTTNNDSPQIINSDPTHEPLQTKSSMSTSSFGISTSKDEQKETNNSSENLTSPAPSVLFRTGKPPIGTRVLPAMDPNGEAPPVKLRPLVSEKKGRYYFNIIDYIFIF